MNIHEHQAKAVLKAFGAPVADGVAIFFPPMRRALLPTNCQARSGW